MAFIISGGNVISFAEDQDVFDADLRLFDANEGLDDGVESSLIRATERILTKLRSTEWWQSYYVSRSTATISSIADIPALDANRIIDRKNDFTDLCIALAMSEYILPKIADFGAADNAEKNKMAYYTQRTEKIFGELITAGDWYDFDKSGSIASSEKQPGKYNLKRVR
jgi:hypothetical protein